jgi:hypothetical protein
MIVTHLKNGLFLLKVYCVPISQTQIHGQQQILKRNMSMRFQSTFTRKEVLGGLIEGAPSRCGAIQQNGQVCETCPTFFIHGTFSCGKHKQKLDIKHVDEDVDEDVVEDKPGDCPICLCDIIHPNCSRTLCGHFFHETCLNTWKNTGNTTCPLCRTPLMQITCEEVIMSRDEQFLCMVEVLPLPWIYLVRRIDDDIPVLFYPTTDLLFMDMRQWCPDEALDGNAFTMVLSAIQEMIN